MLAAVTLSSGMFLPAGPPSYFCSTALELAYDREYRGKLEGLPRLPTLYHFAPLR